MDDKERNPKEKKKISWKDFGPERILLMAIAGVILLVTNFPSGDKKDKKEEDSTQNVETVSENEAYIDALENKLVHILEKVEGVGQVEVMITLKSSKESILNKDDSLETETEEETADDNKTERKSSKSENETVLADADGTAAPYVVKELEPEISGVVISCEGAEDNRVVSAVTEAVQVLFDVSVTHIKVLKMEVLQ